MARNIAKNLIPRFYDLFSELYEQEPAAYRKAKDESEERGYIQIYQPNALYRTVVSYNDSVDIETMSIDINKTPQRRGKGLTNIGTLRLKETDPSSSHISIDVFEPIY